ncbi:hypothetical protein BACI349Y_460021 [Bacillus sp. 349Y]|nr:hypothetical protein BACI349Y_460021 [Bacillus sp. 349Y]
MLDLITAFFSEEDAEEFKVKKISESLWVAHGPEGIFYILYQAEDGGGVGREAHLLSS